MTNNGMKMFYPKKRSSSFIETHNISNITPEKATRNKNSSQTQLKLLFTETKNTQKIA